jgi:hypothetical protein
MSLNLKYGVQLPVGFSKDGICVREVQLRPLNGEDEAFLLEAQETLSAAARVTALLSRCIVRLGGDEAVSLEAIRSLTVGDREALLLHLRSITFGDRMPCALTCPSEACRERMALELFASKLLLVPYACPHDWQDASFEIDGKQYQVRMRVPNGLDQELLAEWARTRVTEAEDLLLRRCVQSVFAESETPLPVEEMSAELTEKIASQMAAWDPQAEILLSLQCPTCGHLFTAELDSGAFFYQELRGHIPYLYREVHQMARSYHWSEAEILAMTPKKRSLYLNLLAGEGVHA